MLLRIKHLYSSPSVQNRDIHPITGPKNVDCTLKCTLSVHLWNWETSYEVMLRLNSVHRFSLLLSAFKSSPNVTACLDLHCSEIILFLHHQRPKEDRLLFHFKMSSRLPWNTSRPNLVKINLMCLKVIKRDALTLVTTTKYPLGDWPFGTAQPGIHFVSKQLTSVWSLRQQQQ
jgi:hypothetical protein